MIANNNPISEKKFIPSSTHITIIREYAKPTLYSHLFLSDLRVIHMLKNQSS